VIPHIICDFVAASDFPVTAGDLSLCFSNLLSLI